MKKFTLIALIPLFLLILSGCVEGVYHLKVNKNGSADAEFKLAMNPFILGISDNDSPISKLKKKAESEGYQVANYKSGNLVGIQAKKHYHSLRDFKGLREMFNQKGEIPLKVKKSLFTTTYFLDGNIDLSDLAISEEKDFIGVETVMIKSIDLRFLLTLPVKIENHNASNVTDEGQTLEWILIPGEDNPIHLEAKIINITNIAVVIIGLLVLVIFVIILKKKKLKNS